MLEQGPTHRLLSGLASYSRARRRRQVWWQEIATVATPGLVALAIFSFGAAIARIAG